MIEVMSYGGGVQSTAMALLAAHGVIRPDPDDPSVRWRWEGGEVDLVGIFADTQWEPREVYQSLEWIRSPNVLPFKIHIVTAGDIRAEQIGARVRGRKSDDERWASLPYFTRGEGDAKEGRVTRQCTSEYKIQPIEKWCRRELLGLAPRQRAPREPVIRQWRGISTDEASRMKPSRHKWMTVRYPLAMELRMSRHDCLAWIERNGYPKPARSACLGCPFHSNHEWRAIMTDPEQRADVVEFDRAIRWAGGMERPSYLHRSCKPLDEVDFATDEERGQQTLFGEECEGMCGL